MEQKQITMIVSIILVVALFLGIVYYVKENSGVNPPFTVIQSQSMQHSNDSQIGVIDTGDMIYVQNTEKHGITTFMEGYASGYKSFGDYGDVIIYNRTGNNPVIHRAIMWMEWTGSNWDLSALQNYDETLWDIDGTHNTSVTSGTLNITISNEYRNKTYTLNIGSLIESSGYLTLGDNNSVFDQNSGISYNVLISKERIKSVALTEIPWLGVLKLMFNGEYDKVENNVPSSPVYLSVFIITLILVIFSIVYIYDEFNLMLISKKLR